MIRQLPRSRDPAGEMVIPGAVWDRLCDMVERALRVEVTPPMFSAETPGGLLIGMRAADNEVRPLIIHAKETGGGYYKADFLAGNTDSTLDGSTNLAMPVGMTLGTNNGVLLLNPAETGTSGHRLATNGASYGAGLIIGRTREATPRTVAIWLGDARDVFYVTLAKTFGADGTNSSAPAYVYTATDEESQTYTSITPSQNRPNGSTVVATKGIGRIKDDGTFQLIWCDEVANTGACATPAPEAPRFVDFLSPMLLAGAW